MGHVAAEHFGGLERAGLWRSPNLAACFGVEIARQRGIRVFQAFAAGGRESAAKIAAVGGAGFGLAVADENETHGDSFFLCVVVRMYCFQYSIFAAVRKESRGDGE